MSKTLSPPRDITVPEPGSTTAREVLSQALRRALQELARLSKGSDPQQKAFAPVFAQLLARAPGALIAVLRAPTVGGLLRCLRRRELDATTLVTELLATLYTDLAVLAALPEPVTLTRLPPRILSLPARRTIEIPEGTQRAEFSNGQLRMFTGGEPIVVTLDRKHPDESAFVAIDDALALALADNNPLAMFEAHPDKQGNALALGGHPTSAWSESLGRALELIGRHMPDLRREIELYLQLVVPVGYDEHKHLSASYQEIIGTVYMTLHPQLMTMVEATIHEFQHNKLHALLELDPLLINAFSPLYTSPVRPDPRPLQGVLLAVHAFVPVARLYQLMREAGDPISEHPEFERRYRQIVAGNHEGAQVLLEHAQPTPMGRTILDEIRRWDAWSW